MSTPEALKSFYEEQLEAQRGMLSGAIEALKQKNATLEKNLERLKNRNHQLQRVSYSAFHQMRAPMVSLLGLVRLLDDEPETDLTETLLSGTENLVDQLDRFAVGLHEFTTETNKEVKVEKFDLRQVLNDTIAFFQEACAKNNVNIQSTFCPKETSPFILNHDRRKVQLVLKKIIENAVQYGAKGSETTTVTIGGEQRKDGALVWIKDNGPGMPQEVALKATDMFYKGTNTSLGAGLGLYITKTLMAENGGLFKVTSRQGKGTSVFLKFKNLYLRAAGE